jgi:hypothetical protein
MTVVHRITELSKRQQTAVVILVNRLASLDLPDDFAEQLLERTANDAEQLMTYMLDAGFARAIDKWLSRNMDSMLKENT